MTEKDKILIKKAKNASCWEEIACISEKADTEEAREELRRLEIRRYHYDEFSSGLL